MELRKELFGQAKWLRMRKMSRWQRFSDDRDPDLNYFVIITFKMRRQHI